VANQKKQSTEAAIRDIRRRTRRKFSPEEKIRIVLEGLRGEQGRAAEGRTDLRDALYLTKSLLIGHCENAA